MSEFTQSLRDMQALPCFPLLRGMKNCFKNLFNMKFIPLIHAWKPESLSYGCFMCRTSFSCSMTAWPSWRCSTKPKWTSTFSSSSWTGNSTENKERRKTETRLKRKLCLSLCVKWHTSCCVFFHPFTIQCIPQWLVRSFPLLICKCTS